MKRSHVVLLWLAAMAITVGSAAWQRRTGPTYPVRGTATLSAESIPYRLLRSQNTGEALPVRIRASAAVTGEVLWRRYPSNEVLRRQELVRHGEELTLDLPAQPPAGKLEYFVHLTNGLESVELPPQTVVPRQGAVARFKGAVPAWVLAPHIAAMFFGMLFSNAAALSALARRDQARRQAWVAFVLLAVGGLLLGPAVQKYAFDAWWTGWPFGHDLTDNKTAVAVVAWGIALLLGRGGRPARVAILIAALVTLVVFVVPHSMFGSELQVQ
ncbi:MAG: hypothetical protein ABI689_00715 [Thermoanaerobaculia bacterium]